MTPTRKRLDVDCPPERHEGSRKRCDDDRRRSHDPRDEHGPSKIVERTWYFDVDEDCDESRASELECESDRDRSEDGKHRRPGRPTRPAGRSNGRLEQGGPLTKQDLHASDTPGVWVGSRAEMDLPYLFMRANPADLGARPVVGPFWESPDIFIFGGVTPSLAPAVPPSFGQIAVAGEPNTIYAHVWNFGKTAAKEVFVEFYWCNPALGISSSSVTLVAQTAMSLGSKGSGRSHAVVKCPEPWTPTFVNGGHECLLVRVWDNPSDLPGEPTFDASINRHVAQRNIHVVPAADVVAHGINSGPPGRRYSNPCCSSRSALQRPGNCCCRESRTQRGPLAPASHRKAWRFPGDGPTHRLTDPLVADDDRRRPSNGRQRELTTSSWRRSAGRV